MQYVRFGQSGLKVSRVCLGCMTYGDPAWREWVLPEAEAVSYVAKAWELGINFFDTANVYSEGASEIVLGKALKQIGMARDQAVIATKVCHPMGPGANDRGLSRKHVMAQIDASLKRLGTDYVDLYQIHRYDPETPVEETLEALDDIVRAGKALYIGASSMWAWQFARMREIQKARGYATFISMQNYYNLIDREEEREMMPYCASEGVAVMPWSPMARGYLAGGGDTTRARTDTTTPMLGIGTGRDAEIRDRVMEVAARLDAKPAHVALAWVLSKPYVSSPIIGASKPHHLEDTLKALDLALDADTIAELEAPYAPKAVTSHQ